MADKIRLSIITPSLNSVHFIGRCLDNVIRQLEPGIEHVIVDGASRDGTLDEIRRYKEIYPHIRLIAEPDRCQSEAMNKGIKLARGEIIGILNVDDEYCEGTFNHVLSVFPKLKSPGLYIGDCIVFKNGEIQHHNRPRRFRYPQCLLGHILVPFPLNSSAYFYPRELHDLVGPYNEDEHLAMDLDFLLRASQAAYIHYENRVLGIFHLHADSKSFLNDRANNVGPTLERIYSLYQAELPWIVRFPVRFLYQLFNHPVLEPLGYFWNYPEEISWRAKKRLKGFFPG